MMSTDAILTVGLCGIVILSFFAINGHTQRDLAIQKFISLKGARKKIFLRWLHNDPSTNRLLQTIYRESYFLAAAKGAMIMALLVGAILVFSGAFEEFYYHLPFVLLMIAAVQALKSKIEDSIKVFDSTTSEIPCD